MDNQKTLSVPIVLLICVLIFHIILNYIWISNDAFPSGMGDVWHHYFTLDLHRKLAEGFAAPEKSYAQKLWLMKENIAEALSMTNDAKHTWPKLMQVAAATSMCLFGSSRKVVMMTNQIYLILLLVSVFLIGSYCYNQPTGILAAFLVSVYPSIVGISHFYELDFPLISFVALSIYLLLKTENFKRTFWAVMFGVACGLAANIKTQFIFFIAAPFVYMAIRIIADQHPRRSILNLFLSLTLGLYISSLWWSESCGGVWQHFLRHCFFAYLSANTGICSSFSTDKVFWPLTSGWFLYYLKTLPAGMTLFLLSVFIFGLWLFFKTPFKHKSVIILWLLASYIIFTYISIKRERYYFPAYPAFALISAAGIMSLKRKQIKGLFIFIIIATGLVNYLSRVFTPQEKLSEDMKTWCLKYNVGNQQAICKDLSLAIIPAGTAGRINVVLVNWTGREDEVFSNNLSLRYCIDLKYANPKIDFKIYKYAEGYVTEVTDKIDYALVFNTDPKTKVRAEDVSKILFGKKFVLEYEASTEHDIGVSLYKSV